MKHHMKKMVGSLRSILALLAFAVVTTSAFGQSKTLIYVQDFDQEPVTMQLNASIGLTFGTNQWVVNDEYDGASVYPNTPSQLITIGSIGNIGTPNSNYLHIHDLTTNATKNTNFKSTNSSVQWADMGSGICTYGYDDVTMVFWWTAGGSANNFGEVYYSVDGGSKWNLATNTDGETKYFNNDKGWKYTKITDPAFRNQDNLQFAFKWTNDGSAATNEMSWGIDDIMVVGEFDPNNPPGSPITAGSLSPTVLCHEWFGNVFFSVTFPDSMCAGAYSIEISDSAGNFANGTTIGIFQMPNPHIGGLSVFGQLPLASFFGFGTCFKFRINRLTPPAQTGTGSICFTIENCPDTVSTMQPAVTMDPNYSASSACNPPGMPAGQQPVCIQSVIDVPFMSFGAFNPGNAYALELSDSSGYFPKDRDSATIIGGPSPSTRTWDPKLPYMPPPPGSQSGKIPWVDFSNDTLPEGCNYYLRVVSTDTHDVDVFIPWGPFCIKHCDIKTNETQDITVCITNNSGYDTLIPVDINMFPPGAFYKPGNQYKVQLLDPGAPPAPMTIVSEGDIGVLVDTVSGKLFLSIPNLPGWLNLGLSLKMYYMRIIATNSSDTCCDLGTLIRLTVGGVGGAPLTINVSPDSVICGSSMIISFIASPQEPTSKYIWTIDGFSNPPLGPSVSLNGQNLASGPHWVTVQEVGPTGNCVGPISDTFWFHVKGPPSVDILGDFDVCVGETVTYTVEFFDATYYDWEQAGGVVVRETNTEITITWTTVGTGSVQLWALGRCGEDFSSKVVNIHPETDPLAHSDTVICHGAPIEIWAENQTVPVGNVYTWYTAGDSTNIVGDSSHVQIVPDSSAEYVVTVDFFGCDRNDTIFVEVIGASIAEDEILLCETPGDSALLDVWVNEDHLTGFTWEPTVGMSDPDVVNPMVKPDKTTMYTLYATFDAGCPPETIQVLVTVVPVAFDYGPVPDVTILRGQKAQLYASGGTSYQWTPDIYFETPSNIPTPIVKPEVTTTYEVEIIDANGCAFKGPLTVNVLEKAEIFIPNVFSPNADGTNDVFSVIDLGIEELIVFKVYNRWGEVIFETNNINEGWDGTYKGEPQEIGTYVYHVEAKIISLDDAEVHQTLQGDVTLIR
jgi:gliding motility-associated-like protein